MLPYLLKILLVLISLGLLLAWFRATFNTSKYSSFVGLKLESPAAKSVVRGNVGGLYLSIFVMTCLFLLDEMWAYPLSIIVCTIIIGRLYSFYLDGYSKLMLHATAIEIVSAVILLLFVFSVIE